MSSRTLGVVVALAAGIVLFYLDRRATRAELAALWTHQAARAEPAEPRPAVPWSSPQVPRAADVPPSPGAPVVERAAPAAIERSSPSKAPTMIEQFAPVHDALEVAFGAEAHDGAWAMNAQRTAENALTATLPPQSAIRSVDCRTTLCRIESTHGSYEFARTFVNQLVGQEGRPWNGGFYTGPVAQDPSGAVTFVTYLSREGAAMPAISERASDEAR